MNLIARTVLLEGFKNLRGRKYDPAKLPEDQKRIINESVNAFMEELMLRFFADAKTREEQIEATAKLIFHLSDMVLQLVDDVYLNLEIEGKYPGKFGQVLSSPEEPDEEWDFGI